MFTIYKTVEKKNIKSNTNVEIHIKNAKFTDET